MSNKEPRCRVCDSMSVDSLGMSSFESAIAKHDCELFGCKDCGMVFSDSEYTEEMWVNI